MVYQSLERCLLPGAYSHVFFAMRAFQRLTALLVSTHSHQTRSLLCWGRVRKLLQILAMAWLRVVNAIALAGWTWLLLHSVLPTCSGLVARDELAGQGRMGPSTHLETVAPKTV